MSLTGERENGLWSWRESDGEVEVRFTGKGPRLSREALFRRLLPADTEPAWLRQIHSAEVLDGLPGGDRSGDALVTGRRRLALSVVTADCVPVLIAGDSRIAAVHAGWRGLAQSILPATLERAGVAAESLTAWIGPAIGSCCYEVGHDVAEQVCAAASPDVAGDGPRGRPHLDLVAAARWQLQSRGVTDVRCVDFCTRCDAERLYSYRRDGKGAGRNVAAIWLR
ncbi:MAG: peptidoglycan editing factor PgeF [bacterium]|nr:peptidoglycan editing factor PgeF [bacterium]